MNAHLDIILNNKEIPSQLLYVASCVKAIKNNSLEGLITAHETAISDKQVDMSYYVFLFFACIQYDRLDMIDYLHNQNKDISLDILFHRALKGKNSLVTGYLIEKMNYAVPSSLVKTIKAISLTKVEPYPSVYAQIERQKLNSQIKKASFKAANSVKIKATSKI